VAWLQLDRLRDPTRFGAWLAGIGRMLCLRELRRRNASRELLTADGSLPDAPADERDAPPVRLLAEERATELAAAIAELPAGQRDAVVLFHLADLSQATVADHLGTGTGAVTTRLHKARAALRQRLTTTDAIEEDAVPPTAVPARIADVIRTPAERHVVILATEDAELPIWIGAPEAEALVAGLEDVELPRPNAHALALSLLRSGGRSVSTVRVTRLESAIFYAEVLLDNGTAVDARPSDALVLAIAADVPVEIDPAVLAAAREGAPDEYTEDLASAGPGGAAVLAEELRATIADRAAEIEQMRDSD
jgi:RNA polymerase sigma factor (sigma-70 family)